MVEVLHSTKTFESLKSLEKEDWDRVASPSFPFTDYEFLLALETSRSVGSEAGWLPLYLTSSIAGELQGASYLYLKNNSYGEYIFDWGWAQAYGQHGIPYYPKLTSSIPFTPATGPKLLFAPGADRPAVASQLIQAAKEKMEKTQSSSLHYLFLSPEEILYFENEGFLIRHSFQYHWRNRNFGTFDDFLLSLKARKRKQILKERRELEGERVKISVLTGEKIRPEHAAIFYEFYRSTIEKMGAIPYLQPSFFEITFSQMKDRLVLFLGELSGEAVAGSFCFKKGSTLFGRYWGATREVKNLHFELCYYRPLEYAIDQKLTLFEAGAQGEHKIPRGFLPELTYSAHWIKHPGFREAISRFIDEEKLGIQNYFAQMKDHSPYSESGSL